MTLNTPQYPDGRDVIVISNDITYQIGSFGPNEDILFKVFYNKHRPRNCCVICHPPSHMQKASEMARQEGLPRIYIAANSGARIGLANEVKSLFKIAWVDISTPDKVCVYTKTYDYICTVCLLQ